MEESLAIMLVLTCGVWWLKARFLRAPTAVVTEDGNHDRNEWPSRRMHCLYTKSEKKSIIKTSNRMEKVKDSVENSEQWSAYQCAV